MKRAILVHGFNVRDRGADTVGKLRPHLEDCGFSIVDFCFGWRGLLMVRFGNEKRAAKLAAMIKDGDVLIGHSDGCNLINMACWLWRMTHTKVKCVYFNPALDKDTPLCPTVEKTLVFHTRSDKVVWLSKFLFGHRWGQMGRIGYQAKHEFAFEPRYENCEYESLGIEGAGHSGVFKSDYNVETAFRVMSHFLDQDNGIPRQ